MDFFDTSVLVAAFDASDISHKPAWTVFARRGETGAIALHTLAETFSVLTAGARVRPREAFELIRTNTAELKKIRLSELEYLRLMENAEKTGLRGGAIYDALILACARKAAAARIWTFNTRHFLLLASDLKDRVCEP